MAAGLLYRQISPPHATYLFKHALIQDAAYGSLLRSRRRHLHGRIASALESHFPEIAVAEPQLDGSAIAPRQRYTRKRSAIGSKQANEAVERSAMLEAEVAPARRD